MLPSWQLARNNLSGRPWRTVLMVGAVAISAALVVAVSSAITTVQASMEMGLTRILGAAQARVVHPFTSRFDESVLEEVRAWPEVRDAAGRLVGSITLVRADGAIDPETNRPYRLTPSAVGVDLELDTIFSPQQLKAGRLPRSPDEILIDPMVATQLNAEVDDRLHVQRFGDPIELIVVGIFEREQLVAAIQRPMIRLDRRMLGEAAGHVDQLTSIQIRLHEDEDVEAFLARYAEALPEPLTLEPAEMFRAGFDRRVEATRFGVIITSVLTFMSAGFIIVTALTSSVIERQREMATMRSIGAMRSQIVRAQLTLGAILGLIGGVIGIPLGLALTAILATIYRDLLPAGLAINPLGLSLSIVGAIGAGVLGALYPAWLAGRVSPLEAMARPARPPQLRSILVFILFGLALVGVQLLLMLPDDRGVRFFSYAYVGLPSVHLGYFLLAIPVLIGMCLLLSRGMSRLFRLPADMLGRSILATPFRHGFTAGALMVGVSILVSTWSGGQSLMRDWVGQIEFADGFAYHPTGINPEAQAIIGDLDFVEAICPIGYMPLQVIGQQVFGVEGIAPANVIGVGFDPKQFFEMNTVEWLQGNPETAIPRLAQGDAVIVADRFLIARNLGVGDTITLGGGRVERDFEIVGVVSSAGLDIATQVFGIRSAYMEYSVSAVFLDFETVATHFGNRDAYLLQVNLSREISDEEAGEAIADAVPGVRFRSGRWIKAMIEQIGWSMLAVQSVIAFAALVLASLGVGNVIIANIHSRRFEYGVLRAAGASRGVLLRLIVGEAMLLAMAGAMTGTLLGLHLAWVGTTFYRDLAGIELRLSIPVIPMLAGWLTVIALTVAVALPTAIGLMRATPSVLLAARRND